MAFISYSDVIDGLFEALQGISGFIQLNNEGAICNLLKYEPKVIQTTPTVYMLLDNFTREHKGQITTMRYRILMRLVLQWQENDQSEIELMPFVHSIPHQIDLDPTLGGRVNLGLAQVSEAQSGFVLISQTKYRCLDFYVDAPTKSPVRSGI